jgi:hypothetical protein
MILTAARLEVNLVPVPSEPVGVLVRLHSRGPGPAGQCRREQQECSVRPPEPKHRP